MFKEFLIETLRLNSQVGAFRHMYYVFLFEKDHLASERYFHTEI